MRTERAHNHLWDGRKAHSLIEDELEVMGFDYYFT